MIRPFAGAAFTLAADGDMRGDPGARHEVSRRLGISPAWGTVTQVHGNAVVEATESGDLGRADAVFTLLPRLPLAVFTADCAGVVIAADRGVGVAHAGWRGSAGGVVESLLAAMRGAGLRPVRAAVGPMIGPCCYEVGEEVVRRFPGHSSVTSWGAPSVDLGAAVAAALEPLAVTAAGLCTGHDTGTFSHRRDSDQRRMAALGWWSG